VLFTDDELMDALRQETRAAVVACEAGVASALVGVAPQVAAGPVAADALVLALPRIYSGDFDDVATLDANYLRRVDIEIAAKTAAREAAAGGAGKSAPPAVL
jgi:tRNA threonylcarbamoyladenosine biosynthesis protein TsaB